MREKDGKLLKIFNYMSLILAVIIFICMFLSPVAVANTYFIALLVCVVLLIVNNHYGNILVNSKINFFTNDIINLVSVVAIIYYEYTKHTMVLNVFLIILIVLESILLLLDVFLMKKNTISKFHNSIIGCLKIGTMICILTYFFDVSQLWFAIDAVIFEVFNLIFKIYLNKPNVQRRVKKGLQVEKLKEKNGETSLEKRIHSAGQDEGDLD